MELYATFLMSEVYHKKHRQTDRPHTHTHTRFLFETGSLYVALAVPKLTYVNQAGLRLPNIFLPLTPHQGLFLFFNYLCVCVCTCV